MIVVPEQSLSIFLCTMLISIFSASSGKELSFVTTIFAQQVLQIFIILQAFCYTYLRLSLVLDCYLNTQQPVDVFPALPSEL